MHSSHRVVRCPVSHASKPFPRKQAKPQPNDSATKEHRERKEKANSNFFALFAFLCGNSTSELELRAAFGFFLLMMSWIMAGKPQALYR